MILVQAAEGAALYGSPRCGFEARPRDGSGAASQLLLSKRPNKRKEQLEPPKQQPIFEATPTATTTTATNNGRYC